MTEVLGDNQATRPLPVRDPGGRWASDDRRDRGASGRRPSDPPVRLEQVVEDTADRTPDAVAVEADTDRLTYAQLDGHANRLAHVLLDRGVGPGSRVAILLHRSASTYVALLAVLKAGAVFVPIDPESPADRVAYVAEDADVRVVLSSTDFAGLLGAVDRDRLLLDDAELAGLLAIADSRRPATGEGGDTPAYVIYTSGSSGRPKGVEVAQESIVNFVEVVADLYDLRPDDRVHQGMTISFDFSIEEIWPTWAVGATLVAGPNDERRMGADLGRHLDDAGITVLYAVPTLLATVPHDLPTVRTIMVGGEACPAEMVERWSRPGRRMLNTYGPTEATVTATWTELHPGRPVTIGSALPTYTAELTDPEDPAHRPVAPGEVGEITLGGPGVARGYLNRPELTAEKFVVHPAHGERVYRTGDLGRFTDDGEIEYLGRADAEVKVRGHRVDLGEVESVLLADQQVGAAVVALAGSGDLAAYVVPAEGGSVDAVDDGLAARVRTELDTRLPEYMVPTTLDLLDDLPTQASGKVDRTALPEPAGRRLTAQHGPVVAAAGDDELRVATVLARVLGLDVADLSVTAHFFDDLGGHSLLAATAVTALREEGLTVAMRDLYARPSVRELAAGPPTGGSARAEAPVADRPAPLRHRTRRVLGAGAVQALVIYLGLLVGLVPVAVAYDAYPGAATAGWIGGLVAGLAGAYVLGRWVLPLLARPVAAGIGPGTYPLWGVTYLRLWLADGLVALSPLATLAGSPLAGPYLRLLGARVGRDVHLASADVGLPALVELGDEAALGYGVHLRPWHVADGRVVVDRIQVGTVAAVATGSVLEAGSEVADGGFLGEQSVLAAGRRIPDAAAWAGSPATELAVGSGALRPDVDAMRSGARLPGWRRRHVAAAVAGVAGLELAALLAAAPGLAVVLTALAIAGPGSALVAAGLSAPLVVLSTCLVVATGRRLVLPRTPVGIHPLRSGLGLRKWLADRLMAMSLTGTNTLYATLYTAPWLRLLGARVGRRSEVSTVSGIDPDLLDVGDESFVADMATVGSATVVAGRIVLRPTRVGHRAFVGNAAVAPAGTDTGAGSLLGVLTVPPRGGVPAGSSWLGSPAIDLPRRQDSGDYAESETFRPSRGRVAGRLAVEAVRILLPPTLAAVVSFLVVYGLFLPATAWGWWRAALIAPALVLAGGLASFAVVVALKWLVVGRYRPRVEPLWNVFVRRTELITGLYEGTAGPALTGALAGTPMLPPLLRLLGARVGRRCWIGTTYLTEFDLVHIGDDAAVGRGVSLQTHLFEDRVMKMSHVRVGDGATIGDRAVVLYDAEVGPDVDVGALSLVMKGERLAEGTRWRGAPVG